MGVPGELGKRKRRWFEEKEEEEEVWWGERSGTRRIKPGLELPSHRSGLRHELMEHPRRRAVSSQGGTRVLRRDPSAMWGMFLTSMGTHGLQGVPMAGAPTSPKEGCPC